MATFERGDIVRVPFPYTDRETRQHRPALVVSPGAVGDRKRLLWVVMITSAGNRPWPGDVSLAVDYESVGLPVPSIVRPTKIAMIESRQADRIGTLDDPRMAEVDTTLEACLGLQRGR